jgi:(p)ppGpp synthase/HD superfamily hydrolase
MSQLNKAIRLAAKLGGIDKRGSPYILHPLYVMNHVEGELAKTVAALHDVVEDGGATLDYLACHGFDQDVIVAVDHLTHRTNESYQDYVIRCGKNEVAKIVKLADLEHNFNLPRTILNPYRLGRDLDRLKKYALSWQYLSGVICEASYLDGMRSVITIT